ncbi:MAG TPA: carboxypeptidase regulatory-like domain-containing protein [Methylomirabilota bacterium]|nr:carboxypeptidase regulatory-like domain-containing protein [Methylomirabilota bacterium]
MARPEAWVYQCPRRMLVRAISVATVALAVALAATPAGAAYEEVAVPEGGTLSGVVRFSGTPPKLEPLRVNKNREVCGESKESEALVVGTDLGVLGSVILIDGITRGKKAEGQLLIDNLRCLFVPHVSALMGGTRARVRNSDALLHNTHGFHGAGAGRQTVFNLALPSAGQVIEITKKLTRPGPVRVLCDAHPHMFAWVYVHTSPYVAVSDARGVYRIPGVPPGTYRVTMWHEGFRPKGVDRDGRPIYEEPTIVTKEVTIRPHGTSAVDFELK